MRFDEARAFQERSKMVTVARAILLFFSSQTLRFAKQFAFQQRSALVPVSLNMQETIYGYTALVESNDIRVFLKLLFPIFFVVVEAVLEIINELVMFSFSFPQQPLISQHQLDRVVSNGWLWGMFSHCAPLWRCAPSTGGTGARNRKLPSCPTLFSVQTGQLTSSVSWETYCGQVDGTNRGRINGLRDDLDETAH